MHIIIICIYICEICTQYMSIYWVWIYTFIYPILTRKTSFYMSKNGTKESWFSWWFWTLKMHILQKADQSSKLIALKMRTSQRNDKECSLYSDVTNKTFTNKFAQQQLNILNTLECFENVFVNKGYQSYQKKLRKPRKKKRNTF